MDTAVDKSNHRMNTQAIVEIVGIVAGMVMVLVAVFFIWRRGACHVSDECKRCLEPRQQGLQRNGKCSVVGCAFHQAIGTRYCSVHQATGNEKNAVALLELHVDNVIDPMTNCTNLRAAIVAGRVGLRVSSDLFSLSGPNRGISSTIVRSNTSLLGCNLSPGDYVTIRTETFRVVSVHTKSFYVDPPTCLPPAISLYAYYAASPLSTSTVALAGPQLPEASKATSSVERLTEVKQMLDMGLISELEYDEKKKEIMAGV